MAAPYPASKRPSSKLSQDRHLRLISRNQENTGIPVWRHLNPLYQRLLHTGTFWFPTSLLPISYLPLSLLFLLLVAGPLRRSAITPLSYLRRHRFAPRLGWTATVTPVTIGFLLIFLRFPRLIDVASLITKWRALT